MRTCYTGFVRNLVEVSQENGPPQSPPRDARVRRAITIAMVVAQRLAEILILPPPARDIVAGISEKRLGHLVDARHVVAERGLGRDVLRQRIGRVRSPGHVEKLDDAARDKLL